MNLISAMMGAPWCAVVNGLPDKVVHALTMEAVCQGWDAQHFVAACGADDIKIYPQKNDGQKCALVWPPRVSNLVDGWTRCKACHEATGRRRPSDAFMVAS